MNLWYSAHSVVIQQTFIFLLLALSFQVVLRAGVSSFASIAFYGAGGYVAANLALGGMPLIPILLIVGVGSALVGLALALPLAKLQGLYLGMVTFAFIQITVVAATNGGTFTGGAVGLYGVPMLTNTVTLAVVALLAVLVVSQLQKSSLGRGFAAMRVDQNLTRAMGFEVAHMRAFLFSLSGVLGAVAGALNVLTFTVLGPESFGFGLLVSALTMSVVGGVTSWRGAAIGTLIVTWFPTVFTFLDGAVREIVYAVLVVLVMSYEPDGLMGLLRTGRRWLRSRRSPDRITSGEAGARVDGEDAQLAHTGSSK